MRWTSEFGRISDHRLRKQCRGLSYIRCADGITTVRVEGRSYDQPYSGATNCYLVLGEKGAPASETLSRGLAVVRKHGDSPISYESAMKLAGSGVTVRVEKSYPDGDQGRPFVKIITPGFKVSADHDLLESDVFGLQTAKEEAERLDQHFPGITKSPCWVRAAGQNAVARFGRGGFQAAAVAHLRAACKTAAARRFSPQKALQTLCLDVKIGRPFGFICIEENTGVVLFGGWVTEKEFMDNEDDIDENYINESD